MKTKTNNNTGVSMFKTVDDLKEFLTWAKTQGIQTIKAKGVEVHFSPITFSDQILKELTDGTATLTDTEPKDKKNEEEDLFWSSNP